MVIRFAIDTIINHIRQSLISILLLVISIILIIFSTMIRFSHDYVYSSVDKLLNSGAEKTAILRMEENNYDFVKELAKQPEISTIGCTTTFGIEPFPELYNIQKQYKSNTEEYLGDYLEVIEINKTAATLCDLTLIKGRKPIDLDYTPRNEKDVEYMYLGSYFSDIQIGTEFEDEYTIFIVAGILDSSQRWISESLLNGFDINTIDYTIDCKSSILSFYDGNPSSSDMWVCAANNYNISQVINVVNKLANKNNIDVRYTTLKASYEHSAQDWIILNSILSKLIVIVCFSCVLMLICYQLYRILIMKKEMGIMLSVGFSISEISKAMILSNIILSLIAFLLVIPISFFVVKWWFRTNSVIDIVCKALLKYSYPVSLGVILCITIIISIFITRFLKKLSPLEMIGGQND
ncbi:ABC transporter permease [Ruminococcus sp.]|uniref:FtsX-like permease family protein n=1 Tax=Ruminococcus sp. TaxID=41978 RepID=UPI0025EC7DA0|nr:ABC transporter permease [Ruminococcus sp.]